MIDVLKQESLQKNPAATNRELFDRLIPLVGRTLIIDSETRPGHVSYGSVAVGVLRWARHEGKDLDGVQIDIGRQLDDDQQHQSWIDTYSAVWVLTDGVPKIVHLPEGVESKY